MKKNVLFSVCWLTASTVFAAPSYPQFDGDCSEYEALESENYEMPHGVDLWVHRDNGYVWMCYTTPNDSFGTADIKLDAPSLDAPLNIHVSAQIGEWPHGDEEAAPKVANSDKWWNHQGWFSNAVYFNGEKEVDGEKQWNFKKSPGREFQFSKARFGAGTWRLIFDIRGIVDDEGESHSFIYPAQDGDTETPLIIDVE